MKIAVFTDSFYPGVGGTEQATYGLAEALCKQGHEVVVCCPKFRGYDDSKFPFKVFRANSLRVTNNDYMALPSISFKFKKQVNDFKPDVIHCQSVSGMTKYALKYGKKHNIPVLMTVHTKFKTAFEKNIKSKFIVNCLIKNIVKKLNKSSGVYTVSNIMKNELANYGYKGEASVIKNGSTYTKIDIENNQLEQIKQTYNLQDAEHIMIFVGLVVQYKNIKFSIDALNLIKDKIGNFKFVIVGYGPDFDYFVKYVQSIGLQDNVIFTNKIYDKQVLAGLYKASDLLLFPSIFDTDGLVVVEAAMNKTPTIVIENTGASERIENNVSGFTIKNDLTEYANKIEYLLNNKQIVKTVGENAEKMLPKAWSETAQEYFEEYKKLAEQVDNK